MQSLPLGKTQLPLPKARLPQLLKVGPVKNSRSLLSVAQPRPSLWSVAILLDARRPRKASVDTQC